MGHQRIRPLVQRDPGHGYDHARAHARREQLAHDAPLFRLERRDLVVAVESQAAYAEELVDVLLAAIDYRLENRGKVDD